jgi:hypothetical protein
MRYASCAGTYFYLATVPIWPQLLATTSSAGGRTMAKHFAAFALGCVAIGMVLLNHGHCDANVGAPGGAGVGVPAGGNPNPNPHAGHGGH